MTITVPQDPMPAPDTYIRYVTEYRSKEYIGTENELTWFCADLDGVPDLAKALDLAAKLKSPDGHRIPGAGVVRAYQTRIVQRVWVGTVILTDEKDVRPGAVDETKED